MSDLTSLLQDAPARYRSIRMGVWFRVEWDLARSAASKHPENPVAVRQLTDWPEGGSVEIVYHAWYERPCRVRIERYEPPDHLREISGASEDSLWQYFPGERQGSSIPNEQFPPGPDQWSTLMSFTHEAVPASILEPAEMWWWPEGSRLDPQLWEIGRRTHLDRPAIEAGARLDDWDTRSAWTEILWMADEYRLRIDVRTGILLRAACLVDGREFVTTEVFDLSVDPPIDAALFAYRPPPGTASTSGSR